MSSIETTVPERPVSLPLRRRPETDPLAKLSPEDLALFTAYRVQMMKLATGHRGYTHYLRVYRSEEEGGNWEVHIHPNEFAYQLAQEGRFFAYHVSPSKEVYFWPVRLESLLTVLRLRADNAQAGKEAA